MNSREILQRITSNWPAKILSVVAAIILYLSYRIGTLEERFFSVPLSVITYEGFVAVGEVPSNVRVSLRGQPGEIFLILTEDIDAFVDLTEHSREGQYRAPVLITKSGTAEGSDFELRVEPLEVTITQEEVVSRSIEVFPSVKGFPADGFELAEYEIDPPEIEVEGSRSAVAQLSNAVTDDIDLASRAADFTVRTRVVIDEQRVRVIGSDIVEFRGTVRPVVVARVLREIAIEVDGIAPGFFATPEVGFGEAHVRGSVVSINAVERNSVRLVVDGSEITAAGEYNLPVFPVLPQGVEGLSVSPPTVTVRVQKTEEDSFAGSQDARSNSRQEETTASEVEAAR